MTDRDRMNIDRARILIAVVGCTAHPGSGLYSDITWEDQTGQTGGGDNSLDETRKTVVRFAPIGLCGEQRNGGNGGGRERVVVPDSTFHSRAFRSHVFDKEDGSMKEDTRPKN